MKLTEGKSFLPKITKGTGLVGTERGREVDGNWQREMKFPRCNFSKMANGMHVRLSS